MLISARLASQSQSMLSLLAGWTHLNTATTAVSLLLLLLLSHYCCYYCCLVTVAAVAAVSLLLPHWLLSHDCFCVAYFVATGGQPRLHKHDKLANTLHDFRFKLCSA